MLLAAFTGDSIPLHPVMMTSLLVMHMGLDRRWLVRATMLSVCSTQWILWYGLLERWLNMCSSMQTLTILQDLLSA